MTEQLFKEKAEQVKNLKTRPTNDQLLNLYGLFKQSTEGDNTTRQPFRLQVKERAKWDAWTKCKGLDREQAMLKYINFASELIKVYG